MAQQFSAGPCDLYWKPHGGAYVAIGDTKDGLRWKTRFHHTDINTDRGGQSRVNATLEGGDVELTINWVEYKKFAAVLADTIGAAYTSFTPYTNVGMLATDKAGTLLAIPKAGTTTAGADGVGLNKSVVFYSCLVLSDLDDLLSSKLREGPATIMCFPSAAADSTIDKVWEYIATPSLS